jgi:hypothetical protein
MASTFEQMGMTQIMPDECKSLSQSGSTSGTVKATTADKSTTADKATTADKSTTADNATIQKTTKPPASVDGQPQPQKKAGESIGSNYAVVSFLLIAILGFVGGQY